MPGVHFHPSFRRNPTKRTNTIIRAEEGFGTTRAKQAVKEERLFMVAGSLSYESSLGQGLRQALLYAPIVIRVKPGACAT